MDQEAQLMNALEWIADTHGELFADVKLRDWRESTRKAKLWVKFGPEFASAYGAALSKLAPFSAEDERDAATRLALNESLKHEWWLEHVETEPLGGEDPPLHLPPKNAFLHLWLRTPSDEERVHAAALEGRIPGKKTNDSERHIGGRPGYVVRSPDFYKEVWGLWMPNPKHEALMQYVVSVPTYAFKNADEFARELNRLRSQKQFDSDEGRPFTSRSVRRLNVSRELLLGNEKPTD